MADESVPVLYCTYHPGRETVLRCNKCEKPICYECAIRTPVGYRCKDCVRGQQAVYYNAHSVDLPIAAVIALVVSGFFGVLAYLFLGALGFFSLLIALFVGPVAGGLIAEAVRAGVGRRRARHMNVVAVAATVLGMLAGITVLVLFFGRGSPTLGMLIAGLITRWGVLLFAALAASTVYARLQ